MDNLLEHIEQEYPKEACGVIISRRGKKEYVACSNVAEDPYTSFQFDPTEYIRLSLSGDILQIVHSHPDQEVAEFSKKDIDVANYLNIPFLLVTHPSGDTAVYTPERAKSRLVGREYSFGTNDCYSLVRDYYEQNFSITLRTFPFVDNFWEEGIDYFEDFEESWGFERVTDEPQVGDMIVFRVNTATSSHCGVYVGEGLFLHHAVDRLSCTESLNTFWGRFPHYFLRYKGLCKT